MNVLLYRAVRTKNVLIRSVLTNASARLALNETQHKVAKTSTNAQQILAVKMKIVKIPTDPICVHV